MAERPANFTRRTEDLPGKLRREGRYGMLALYHLLRLSDLGREGIERSGSYRFADHLYANRASGRGPLGWLIDRVLLSLPAARAMRQRCTEATAVMIDAFQTHLREHPGEAFRVLSIPCGLPREVRNFAAQVQERWPEHVGLIEFTGMDLDPEVLEAAQNFLRGSAVPEPCFVQGSALDAEAFPREKFHVISSTGLGEFLDDGQLTQFYANVQSALVFGGLFYTSAMSREPRADTLLQAFELRTKYRERRTVEQILSAAADWREVRCSRDRTELETFVRARKKGAAK